jgi:hypothetical protein
MELGVVGGYFADFTLHSITKTSVHLPAQQGNEIRYK